MILRNVSRHFFIIQPLFIAALGIALFFARCGANVESVRWDDREHDDRSERESDSSGQKAGHLPPEVREAVAMTKIDESPDDYLFPVIDGAFGSDWCICRNVGTSPHIGIDMNARKMPEVSLAMARGVVKSVTFDPACGWGVFFEDSHAVTWRYLHLDKPDLSVGQSLQRGDIVGRHASYPKNSCGTGPHLHLERRSSGRFASAEEFRTCQYGRRSCYYNPKALIQGAQVVSSESERQTLLASRQVALSLTPEAETRVQPSCRRLLQGHDLEPTEVGLFLADATRIDVPLEFSVLSSGELTLRFDGDSFAASRGEECDQPGVNSHDCLKKLEVFSQWEDQTGELQNSFVFSWVPDAEGKFEVTREDGLCVRFSADKSYWGLLTTSFGKKFLLFSPE